MQIKSDLDNMPDLLLRGTHLSETSNQIFSIPEESQFAMIGLIDSCMTLPRLQPRIT
jgi:hypothetical protein